MIHIEIDTQTYYRYMYILQVNDRGWLSHIYRERILFPSRFFFALCRAIGAQHKEEKEGTWNSRERETKKSCGAHNYTRLIISDIHYESA